MARTISACIAASIATAASTGQSPPATPPVSSLPGNAVASADPQSLPPVSDPSDEIVVVGDRPVTRRGAWVFERSDILFRSRVRGMVPIVPAAAWAICMPTADTRAAVQWLAQTGPYLTAREQDGAVQRLEQLGSGALDTNELRAVLPSNLKCYPPRDRILDGDAIDSVQYCRQRKVAIGRSRAMYRLRMLGRHGNTRLSMRYEYQRENDGFSSNPAAGPGIVMSVQATWREECPADGRIPSLIAKKK